MASLKMTLLCARFPSLKGAPGTEPWDSLVFLRWLCSKGLSHGELCAARFVLGVWNVGTDWEELAREAGHPYPEHAERFDLMEAMGVWDGKHTTACMAWMKDPFWP